MVTLDGVNLKELNVKWLRQHIALVQQVRAEVCRIWGVAAGRRSSKRIYYVLEKSLSLMFFVLLFF